VEPDLTLELLYVSILYAGRGSRFAPHKVTDNVTNVTGLIQPKVDGIGAGSLYKGIPIHQIGHYSVFTYLSYDGRNKDLGVLTYQMPNRGGYERRVLPFRHRAKL